MKIFPQKINPQSFAPYGKVYDLKHGVGEIVTCRTQSFTDRMLEIAYFGAGALHVGMTIGSAAPCVIQSMEIHSTTEEMILCIGDPIILCVALLKENDAPSAADIRAFQLSDGEAVVLKRNVWHDACHGVGKQTSYCWLAKACPQGKGWINVDGNAILEITVMER